MGSVGYAIISIFAGIIFCLGFTVGEEIERGRNGHLFSRALNLRLDNMHLREKLRSL